MDDMLTTLNNILSEFGGINTSFNDDEIAFQKGECHVRVYRVPYCKEEKYICLCMSDIDTASEFDNWLLKDNVIYLRKNKFDVMRIIL